VTVKQDGTTDRRRRHADDPTVPITVNVDVTTLNRADTFVVETRGTRSGLIRAALNEYLDRRDRALAEE
jgi:metal-responsive CopG/Arc/MetJ family transcriptional regulator